MTTIPDIIATRYFQDRANPPLLAAVSMLNPFGDAPLMKDFRERGYLTFGTVQIGTEKEPLRVHVLWAVAPDSDEVIIVKAPQNPEPSSTDRAIAEAAVEVFIDGMWEEAIAKFPALSRMKST